LKTQEEKDFDSVKLNGLNLSDVKNQTPEICLLAVSNDGRALLFVKNQTDEIALAAVKQQGYALERVKNQTPEIALAAVIENGLALQFVKNETRELVLAAINNDADAVYFVSNVTDEIALAAVTRKGALLQIIINQTEEIALAAVSQDGHALQFVTNKTERIQCAAIHQNAFAIKYSEKITEEIMLVALGKWGSNLLHFASTEGLTDVVAYMISQNFDVNEESATYCQTPFELASRFFHVGTMRKLIEHGANIYSKNPGSQSNILCEVIENIPSQVIDKHINAVALLLDIGISPTEPDENGITAMILAKEKPEIMSVLQSFQIKKLIQSTISSPVNARSKKKQHL
jgi:ribosomal protein L24E